MLLQPRSQGLSSNRLGRGTGREGEDPGNEVSTIAGLSKLCDAGGGSKILQGEGGVNLYLKNNEAMGQAY